MSMAVNPAVRGIEACRMSSHPAAIAATSSAGQSRPLKTIDGGPKVGDWCFSHPLTMERGVYHHRALLSVYEKQSQRASGLVVSR
jgi:hypothetical protein